MWGFYPGSIHRDAGICGKLSLAIKYSHEGEKHCVTQIPYGFALRHLELCINRSTFSSRDSTVNRKLSASLCA